MSGIPGQLDSYSGKLVTHNAYLYAMHSPMRRHLQSVSVGHTRNAMLPKKHRLAAVLVLGLFLVAFARTGLAFTTSGIIYTTDGSVSDVNAAIAAAPAGATVQIPPGSFTWGTNGAGVYVNNAINLMGSGTA